MLLMPGGRVLVSCFAFTYGAGRELGGREGQSGDEERAQQHRGGGPFGLWSGGLE
jgi:hypothetical protein